MLSLSNNLNMQEEVLLHWPMFELNRIRCCAEQIGSIGILLVDHIKSRSAALQRMLTQGVIPSHNFDSISSCNLASH